MTAVIKYGQLEAGQIYYDLPLFESNPVKHWDSVITICFKDNSNRYWLELEDTQFYWEWDMNLPIRYNEGCEGLQEHQIRAINELYFKMLDNPEMVEGKVEL